MPRSLAIEGLEVDVERPREEEPRQHPRRTREEKTTLAITFAAQRAPQPQRSAPGRASETTSAMA